MLAEHTITSSAAAFERLGGHIDEWKVIDESGPDYNIDAQYVFMNDWCMRQVLYSKPKEHTDVGSQVAFLFYLSNFVPINFIDIRNPGINSQRLRYTKGDLVDLPLKDDSINSLSCLHVAEHVGLGRYGDAIDPQGFVKACKELSRILQPGGNLYFAVPMGKSRIIFNAHRILESQQVLEAFRGLTLLEFGGMRTSGVFRDVWNVTDLDNEDYATGMFHFTK